MKFELILITQKPVAQVIAPLVIFIYRHLHKYLL